MATSIRDGGSASHLPETGLLRLSNILAPNGPIPVSKSTWWGWREGRALSETSEARQACDCLAGRRHPRTGRARSGVVHAAPRQCAGRLAHAFAAPRSQWLNFNRAFTATELKQSTGKVDTDFPFAIAQKQKRERLPRCNEQRKSSRPCRRVDARDKMAMLKLLKRDKSREQEFEHDDIAAEAPDEPLPVTTDPSAALKTALQQSPGRDRARSVRPAAGLACADRATSRQPGPARRQRP